MAVGFDEWAVIQRLHDGTGHFKLLRDLMYRSEAGSVYVVPRGFKTDLASVPRWLWPIFNPSGLFMSAAILHDHFCENDWISRKDGDKIFLEAMLHSNVPRWKRYCIYAAVRAYAVVLGIK